MLCLVLNLQAQKKDTDAFLKILQATVVKKTTNYSYLDSTFRAYKNDTTKMKLFALKSKNSSYLEGQSYALNMLGAFYRNKSMYGKAIENHKEAKELAITSNNIDLKVVSLNMLGVVYRRMDLVRSALDNHSEALKIANSVPNPSKDLRRSIAVSQNSIGNIYLALKEYDLALVYFYKSLAIERVLNNKLGLAINYHNIGYAKEGKGLLEEASFDYKTSLDYNLEINSDIGEVICYNSIGQIYIKQNKLSIAEIMINQALNKALKIDDQYYIAPTYINLGWVQYELDEFEDAEKNIKKGLRIAKKNSLKSSLIEAHKHLSVLNERLENYDAAMSHYKNYKTLEESITNDRNLHYVSDLIIKYEAEDKTNQIKALSSENELVKLKLQQNDRMIWMGIIGFVLTAMILFFIYRNRRVKQEKRILMLEQDMLRSQMNPHFIFNSLNSIKLYIINNEKENAVYYLNKFSKLIRKILVANTEKEMSLFDELETMQLYMNIENIRFSNEIDYQVKIENGLDIERIKVPSLILQPFLENSLWHGLSPKKDDKQIVVNIEKKSSEFITISITDNGLGREASQRIKDQKTLKRKSVGIALTKERLSNFSKRFSVDYTIEITDLYNEEGTANGTKVIINIPINEIRLKTA